MAKKDDQAVTQESPDDSYEEYVESLTPEQKDSVREFIQRTGMKYAATRITSAEIDTYIQDIDKVLSAQMDQILHHELFQSLESTWRGLHFLVQNTEFSKPVKFDILDCSKEEMYEDLENAATGEGYEKESGLYHHIYWGAYDKVGGHPYTSIIADYQFGSGAADIKLLQHLSVLGETAQLPFIGNAGAEFFKKDNMGKVMSDHFLEEQLKEGPEYAAWRAFRDDERSKFVGLTLPRFLGRLPYAENAEETKNFKYTEGVYREGKDNSLWCSTSFALASNMVKGFEKWGWSVKIVGVDSGGKVEGLPTPTYEVGGQVMPKVPIEASVGMVKDQQLCDLGFIPLAHWDRTDYACFFEIPSVQRAKKIKGDDEATANYAVGSRLQYIMLVTRIAHYLKYRQLQHVGTYKGAGEIKADLQKWLDGLVSDQETPPENVVATRPLRSYNIDVTELPEKPGFFQISAEFRPHVAISGVDVKLRLVAYHSGEEQK